jgi:uncharacterized membrane protein YkoI
MNIKVLAGSAMVVGLMGLGLLAGSVVGSGGAFAQTPSGSATSAAQVATTPTPGSTQTAPASPGKGNSGSSSITAKITQQQAEQAALAASPGNTIDHTSLQDQNGTPVYDVDFTNGGGVLVNGDTGAVITVEAAGQDQGGHGAGGGFGGHRGGADQAALAAQAKVTQQQAEQAALAASPGNSVDHSILQDQNGTIVWDVDFTNGGGVEVNAQTGAIVKVEAAGTDQGGRPQAPSTSSTPTAQP